MYEAKFTLNGGKLMKKSYITLLITTFCLSLIFFTACNTQAEKVELAFNENYLQSVELGEPIMLDEYIDPYLTNDYTAILTSNETGQSYDLKTMGQWTTEYPGEFTFTYTVNSGAYRGTISTVITVTVPKIKWEYSETTMVFRDGDTMSFNKFFNILNIAVESYYNYELFVDSVIYNGVETNLRGEREFVFDGEGLYTFIFGVRSEDNQELTATQNITVRAKQVMAEGAQEWLDENNMLVHDYTYVSPDGQISLDAGYYTDEIIRGDVPYVAFENAASLDTYIMTDFTGSNLPQIAFFCDTITENPMDGGRGIYIHNGLTYADGGLFSTLDASRLTVFGPNKIGFGRVDSDGRFDSSATGTAANPCPMSYLGLKDNNQYRYIVGFTDGTTSSVTLRILLINLTTLEREFDHTYVCKKVSGVGAVDFTDYFNGSIVLYGRYGVSTKLDKVYAPITNVDDIYSLDRACSFKAGYRTQYPLNSTVSVSNYIDISTGDYEFKVIDPDGLEVQIAEDGTFTYSKSGTYRLVYDSKEEGYRPSAVTVDVMFGPNQDMGDDYYENLDIFGFQQLTGSLGIISNTDKNFIKEGSSSIKYYSNDSISSSWGLVLGLNSSFMEFMFLSRDIDGMTFDVYAPIDMNFKLYPKNGSDNNAKKLLQDYTGTIKGEQWTTLTITREMFNLNSAAYLSWANSLALAFYTGEALPSAYCIYIDNIKIFGEVKTSTITDGAKQFLSDNDMTAYAYESITDDLQAKLYGGLYQSNETNIRNDDVPYIAYNGNYGVGTYVVADFTGKNVPQFCFFADTVTSSLTDGLAGVYLSSGLISKNGSYFSELDCSRVTCLGPNKVAYRRLDSSGRLKAMGSVDSPAGTSVRGLTDGVHYRYVAGIKSADASTKTVVLHLVLINLDTGVKVYDKDYELTSDAFTEEYLSGNVVMYGRYNVPITLDKIYAIQENVSDVYALDLVSSVLGN